MLDSIVIACVDILVVTASREIVLGKRSWHPQADWWLFGGRLKTGEQLTGAARRLANDELGLDINEHRFEYLTTFAAAWNLRAHAPKENGTHSLSVVFVLSITSEEESTIAYNDEYTQIKVVARDVMAKESSTYHPALLQCISAYDILIDRRDA